MSALFSATPVGSLPALGLALSRVCGKTLLSETGPSEPVREQPLRGSPADGTLQRLQLLQWLRLLLWRYRVKAPMKVRAERYPALAQHYSSRVPGSLRCPERACGA